MTTPGDEHLVARVEEARDQPGTVVLEGFHALKHALRFGAEVIVAVTSDSALVAALADELAPDLRAPFGLVPEVPAEVLGRLARGRLPSPVLAVARRPRSWAPPSPGAPSILLHDPRHPGNLGAVVRVAAAGGAAGVAVVGSLDPWAPAVVRAAAGLHYALPVSTVTGPGPGPTVALDPEGEVLDPGRLTGATLIFGSERHGLPPEVRQEADHVARIPMVPGVSSLNLATSVAVALYLWRAGTDHLDPGRG